MTTSPLIIGIGYTANVGKDAAATALCREFGVTRIGFADRLKEFALELDPLVTSAVSVVNVGAGRGRLKWIVQGLGWEEAKETYPEVRRFLQDCGTAVRDMFGDDVWIDAALNRVPASGLVVPDVRYVNEAEAIKAKGGVLINIVRPGYGPANGHASENELADFDGWDVTLVNDGELIQLEQQVIDFIKGLADEEPAKPAAKAEATDDEETTHAVG